MQPQKLAPTTEVGCGLQKYSTFSKKRAKTLTIFFFIFLIFLAILMKPNKDRRICGAMGRHQYDSKD
jgi:preprotein translocase subunit SecG